MRKENEIYCSNCGTLISLEARFCSKCGFYQVEFPIVSNTDDKLNNEESNSKIVSSIDDNKVELENNKEVIKDNSTKVVGVLLFFFVLGVFYFILPSPTDTSKSSNSSNLGESECTGPGNSSCESEVKNDINKTPQWEVLSISHFGNGRFGVTYLAPSRTGGLTDYYAEYFTDCKCKIADVKYKIAPPL